MRLFTVILCCLSLCGLAFGQSLSELAKKEKERREKNRREGKQVQTITESELSEGEAESEEGSETSASRSNSRRTTTNRRSNTSGSIAEGTFTVADQPSGGEDDEGDVSEVDEIPKDGELEDKVEAFLLMKRQYQNQAQEIDKKIAENNKRLDELREQIATTSSSGGAGLPTAPQAGNSSRVITGREIGALTAEQEKLNQENRDLQARKERMRSELLERGRRAGVPAGYLRF